MTRTHGVWMLIAAVVAGLVWFVALHTYWDQVLVPTPPTGEAATNPFYSVQHLAKDLGVHSRLTPSISSPPHGGVLLVTGMQSGFGRLRVESLEPWIENGGRLVVTGDVIWGSPKLQAWSGISPGSHLVDSPADRPALPRKRGTDADCVPLKVKIDGASTSETLSYCGVESQFEFVSKRVPAWSLSSEYGIQMLRLNIGRGSLSVIPRHWLIGNLPLRRGDHARIFIAAAQLRRGDRLDFLHPTQAEPLFVLMWRIMAPAIVFAAIAVVCLLARQWPRFGTPLPTPAELRRSLAEQIRANAAFAWRTRRLGALRATMSRALEEAARRRIVGYTSLPMRHRVSALAELSGVDAGALNAAMTADAVGTPHLQRSAIALLERTRRSLLYPSPSP